MDPWVGIDLGNSVCRVAVWSEETQSVRIITSHPSCLCFPEVVGEECSFGEAAMNSDKPFNTVSAVRRLIGSKSFEFESRSEEFMWENRFRFLNSNPNDEVRLGVTRDGETWYFSPMVVTAKMLAHLKVAAEEDLGRPVTGAVLSVPSLFTDFQRKLTKEAAEKAGFEKVRLINESSATAIDYGVYEAEPVEKNVMIFDLGGGSFSLAIVGIRDSGNRMKFVVKHVGGNSQLGGKDIDDAIMVKCIGEFLKNYNINENEFYSSRGSDDTEESVAKSLSRLRIECESAKRSLSSGVTQEVTIAVPSFYREKNLVCQFSQQDFEHVCESLLKECRKAIIESLASTKLNQFGGIHKVILLGGCTRIVGFQKLLKSFFETEVSDIEEEGVILEEAVVRGAAIQAFLLNPVNPVGTIARADKYSLSDVTPYDIGIETSGEDNGIRTLIKRNTQIPAAKSYGCGTQPQGMGRIRVYEGLRGWEQSYRLLGVYTMNITAPDPSPGTHFNTTTMRRIEATFEVDNDGILGGYATDITDPYRRTAGYMGWRYPVKIEKGVLTNEDIKVIMGDAAAKETNKRARVSDAVNEPNKKTKEQ